MKSKQMLGTFKDCDLQRANQY